MTLLPQLATEISWRLRKPAFARAASAVDWSAAKSFTARKNTRQEEKSVSRNSVNEAPFTASAAKTSCAF